MRSSLLASVDVTEFQTTEAYYRLNLTNNNNNNNNNNILLDTAVAYTDTPS
jgi:hypothetical protein